MIRILLQFPITHFVRLYGHNMHSSYIQLLYSVHYQSNSIKWQIKDRHFNPQIPLLQPSIFPQ